MFLLENRPLGALVQPADSGIAVNGHDQAISLFGRLLKVRHVARMENVEAAVGEHDALPQAAASGDPLFEIVDEADFFGRAPRIRQDVGQHFLSGDGDDADAFDFQPASDVGQPGDISWRKSCRQAHADRRQHHVAGACDVVHLALASRQQLARAVGLNQRDAVAVERDVGMGQVQLTAKLPACCQGIGGRANFASRGEASFEAIGRDSRRPAVK